MHKMLIEFENDLSDSTKEFISGIMYDCFPVEGKNSGTFSNQWVFDFNDDKVDACKLTCKHSLFNPLFFPCVLKWEWVDQEKGKTYDVLKLAEEYRNTRLKIIEHAKISVDTEDFSQIREHIEHCIDLEHEGLTYCWYHYSPDDENDFSACMCLETGEFFSNQQLVEMGLLSECFADNNTSNKSSVHPNINFSLSVPPEKWNWVCEKGLPPENEWCFIITKDLVNTYNYFVGGYNIDDENTFYVNFGLGGAVTDAKYVVAWAPFFNEGKSYLSFSLNKK